MENVMSALGFLSTNKEVIATLLASIVAVVKLTSWGRAKASALDTVTGVIERLKATQVKQAVADEEARLTAGALDALKVSVAKVDSNKTVPGTATRFMSELFRGILPKKG
jgi:hypothetical protein